jgi:glycosyltransferase involved in cell wall biosynthesis
MARPFISVLIDTYNHERFIEQAITSVLEQDVAEAEREIIIVDDGSTDRTPDLVRKFEPRVRLIRKTNGGQASAFNAGIPECRGEIIAFLDGDDWWARNKLARVAEAMTGDLSVGIVGHGIVTVQSDGSEQAETLCEGFRFRANSMDGARLFRRRGAFLGTSRMTIRSALVRRIGKVPEAIEIQADEYLFTLAAVLENAQILPDVLTYYRLHDSNRFQLTSFDPKRLKRKQNALAILARSMAQRLEDLGIEPQVRRGIIELTESTADQIRLMTEGGWPWETLKTEWKIYRILHPDASLSHRTFKLLTLLAALGTAPKSFYRVQRALAKSGLYLRARQRLLPIPEMRHIQKSWKTRA